MRFRSVGGPTIKWNQMQWKSNAMKSINKLSCYEYEYMKIKIMFDIETNIIRVYILEFENYAFENYSFDNIKKFDGH